MKFGYRDHARWKSHDNASDVSTRERCHDVDRCARNDRLEASYRFTRTVEEEFDFDEHRGKVALGERVSMRVPEAPGRTFNPKVVAYDEAKSMVWED